MTLEYLTALQGQLRSMVDAEELHLQIESVPEPRSLGPHIAHFQCSGMRGA
jgi:hypothetical protein